MSLLSHSPSSLKGAGGQKRCPRTGGDVFESVALVMSMVEFVVKAGSQAGSGKEYHSVCLKCCGEAVSGRSCFIMP